MDDIKVISFDVFGTVVDWFSSIRNEVESLGLDVPADKFARAWRSGYKPAMQKVLSGELGWTLIDDLHFMILEEVLKEFNVHGMTDEEKDHLNKGWHRLAPWPDSSEAIERLNRQFKTCTLSNGNLSLLENLSEYANLHWSKIFSAETFGTYKPDPKMYLGVASTFGVEPSNVLMVATHQDDLDAAKQVGLRTAYVRRPLEYGIENFTKSYSDDNDLVLNDLIELAEHFQC